MLVRAAGAFEAIVAPELFIRATTLIAERNRRFSEAEMLDGLKALRDLHGELSALIIDEQDDLPSSSAYRTRFGSLLRAYKLIGYTPQRDYRYVEINRFLRELHAELVAKTIQSIENVGASVVRDPDTDLLLINGEFTASIVIRSSRYLRNCCSPSAVSGWPSMQYGVSGARLITFSSCYPNLHPIRASLPAHSDSWT